jgi:hypothetical protein
MSQLTLAGLVGVLSADCQAGRKWGVVRYDMNDKELGINTW